MRNQGRKIAPVRQLRRSCSDLVCLIRNVSENGKRRFLEQKPFVYVFIVLSVFYWLFITDIQILFYRSSADRGKEFWKSCSFSDVSLNCLLKTVHCTTHCVSLLVTGNRWLGASNTMALMLIKWNNNWWSVCLTHSSQFLYWTLRLTVWSGGRLSTAGLCQPTVLKSENF